MLSELKDGTKVVGIKQLKKALKDGTCRKVFLARDAESRVTDPIASFCTEHGVELEWASTMSELGAACSIEVGSAAAGLLR